MSDLAPRLVCHTCAHDDDVTAMPAGSGDEWAYVCVNAKHAEPYSWTVKVPPKFAGRQGIVAELGIYEDLLACVHVGEAWVEHGIVEHRYKLLRPDVYFGELVPRYGHVAQGPKRYTTSSLLAGALGQLCREGELAWQRRRATGFWRYNHKISYWAIPPGPAFDDRLTWEDFAKAQGFVPWKWSLELPIGHGDG